jgi:predicted phospho-2-dehydro-3-deoxyheptonate aldolase
MIGKAIRLERIFNRNTGKTVIVPMDHGVSTGPIPGIINMKETIAKVESGGANAIVVHKGVMTSGQHQVGRDMGTIVHLSGSTGLCPRPYAKTLVCTVEEAIKLGADAVSVHVNIGNECEKDMLSDLAAVASKAAEWGMPLLAMMYPRGEKVKNEYDPEAIKHAARLGAELGADVVKVSYTGSPETFKKVVDGCHVPVVIAGGPKMDSTRAILEMVSGAMKAGAAGTSIGRNIFQHRNPAGMVRAICKIVHENKPVGQALTVLTAGGGAGYQQTLGQSVGAEGMGR